MWCTTLLPQHDVFSLNWILVWSHQSTQKSIPAAKQTTLQHEKKMSIICLLQDKPSSSLFKAFTIDKDSQSAFFLSLGMFLFVWCCWYEAEEGVSCLVNGAKSNFFLQGKIPKWDLKLEKVQFMAGKAKEKFPKGPVFQSNLT